MPQIRFRLDTSFDNYAKIDALLRSPAVARDLNRLGSNTADINPKDDDDAGDTSDADGGDGGE
jgi:ribosome-binding factor A